MTPGATLEVEAKFDVLARAPTRALLEAPDLAGLPGIGPARRVRQLDRYLDTPDGRLYEAGWAARLRTVDADTRIQLKRIDAPGRDGVTRRTELDGPAGPDDDPASWPRSAARRRLLQLLHGDGLATRLTLRQDRLVRDFGDDGCRVELSLDRTSALAAEEVAGRLTILELELRAGNAAGFDRAAAELRALPFLSPSRVTKLGWGSGVVANRTRSDALPIIGDDDPSLTADDPTAEIGRRILRAQLRRLLDRERAFLLSPGPEEIRRMRVATRRLRATWRAFGPLFEGRTPDRLRRRLGRLGDALSAVRDLDVLLARLDTYTAGSVRADGDGLAGLAGLTAAITGRRAAALARLEAELAAPRHPRWLDAFVEFVETPGRGVVPATPPAPRLAREQVGGWIWTGFERVMAWEPLLPIADLPTLHLLRIDAKRLRDLVQVVAPISTEPPATIVATLVRLQDTLGAMNDATVTAGACRAYLDEHVGALPPTEARAIVRFAIGQERAAELLRRRAPAAWRGATSPLARRRLGRFIGGLGS